MCISCSSSDEGPSVVGQNDSVSIMEGKQHVIRVHERDIENAVVPEVFEAVTLISTTISRRR